MNNTSSLLASSKILIIKFGGIGDVLLASPVIENLKLFNPKFSIDVLTERSAATVVIGNPFVNRVFQFDRRKDSGLSLIRMIRNQNYDTVIDLYANPRTALVTKFSGAGTRIGFPFRGRGYAYNIQVAPRSGEVHNVEFNLDALRRVNIPVKTAHPLFPIENSDRDFADEWIKNQKFEHRPIVGINPSGGWYTKKWKLESFARLADQLQQWKQWNILFIWGPGELNDVQKIKDLMNASSTLAPATTLKQMAALIGKTSYFISNDAGPMHIAAAAGVPTLGIYGPTNPHLQGPYGKKNLWVRNEEIDCLECNLTRCPIGNICMTDLNVETVFASFKKLVTMNQ
ncbi:MAG: glycosyltransferase family 9 protein [Bacteroidota bacterium]